MRRDFFVAALSAVARLLVVLALHAALFASAADDESRVAHIKLLAINDFHGHLAAGTKFAGRPAGGAAVLAAYLKAAQRGVEDRTLIVNAGDNVGASPLASALLADEPTIMFFNQLANEHCRYDDRTASRCNMVSTLGNHEFDRGLPELKRLLDGGNSASGSHLENPWRGARFATLNANVVHATTRQPVFTPWIVKEIDGVKIGFIGIVLRQTPEMVSRSGIEGLQFLDEVETINRYSAELRSNGTGVIVVLMHQGGSQDGYVGATLRSSPTIAGEIASIAARLNDGVDVIVSGHAHSFTNARLANASGKPMLVTQAWSYGMAFADIDITVDRVSGRVTASSASIVATYTDAGPGLRPDPDTAALVRRAEESAAPIANRAIASLMRDVVRTPNAAGESPLGDLIADAQRVAMGADIAFMNPGGIRDDLRASAVASLPAGTVTYGDVYAVHPFGNRVLRLSMTGEQVYRLLAQQFSPTQRMPRMLQVSGLSYTYDAAAGRILEVRQNGRAIGRDETFTVAVNDFLAGGGDRFEVFSAIRDGRISGPLDRDALADYLRSLPQPVVRPAPDRILRVN